MQNRSAGWIVLAFLLVVSALIVVRVGTPPRQESSASPNEFSTDRAFQDLNTFATAPHPVGSAEHDRVRDYLLAQLTSIGITPEIQKTTGVTPRYEVAGTVENIVARLKGTSGATDAVALVAHYDSVPAGPGAGDDGAGVAALLETLRVLHAGPPMRNDILFLFTDGEEDGLLGASAFAAENPAAKDVRVAINFEARGNSGESQMFETSAENGRLVQIFAESAPHPAGSSLTYEVYKHMPNDTDMTVFRKAGLAGLNFAFIGDWEAYHTPLDNPASLDRGSIQQHGENALALARSFGNADLSQLRERDDVFFSLPFHFFVRYSSRVIWPLTIGAGVFLLGMIFYADGAWQMRLSAVFVSLLLNIGFLILLGAVGLGYVLGVAWLHLNWLPEGSLIQNYVYTLGLFALLAALFVAIYKWFSKKIDPPAFFLGGAILVFILLVVLSKWLPGGAYVLLWPLIAALLATVTVAFRAGELSSLAAILLCILSLPALFLFVPLLKGFFQALGFSTAGAPLLSVTFVLFFLLLLPFLEPVLETGGKRLALLAFLAAIVLFAASAETTRYSATHPKPSVLAYALDADTGKASWSSSAARVDTWSAQYLGLYPQRGRLPDFYPVWYPIEFLLHDAPVIALAPPQAELVDKSADTDSRTLHLHILTPRLARAIHVGVAQAEVLSASVNGHDLGKPSEARWHTTGQWGFDYVNPTADGIDLQLHVRGLNPLTLVLVDRSSGLPPIPGRTFAPRPPDSMPIHSGDETMVRRSFVF